MLNSNTSKKLFQERVKNSPSDLRKDLGCLGDLLEYDRPTPMLGTESLADLQGSTNMQGTI